MARTSYADSLSKRASILYESYSEVKKWYDESKVAMSLRTIQGYVDSLSGFLKEVGMTPSQLLKLSPDDAHDLMRSWAIQKRQSRTISDGRIGLIWHGVRNFLEFHRIRTNGKLPFTKVRGKYLDKIPTKDELKLILDSTPSLPVKIAILLMGYSGLRPEDVVDLTYGCVKNDFEKDIAPCAVYVPQSKTGEDYVTFIPKVTVNLLKQYFKHREEEGEMITDSSPIYRGQRSRDSVGIRRKTLTQNIEFVLKRSGIELSTTFGEKIQRMRPHSLRKYFRSNLSGHVPTEYAEFWVGHTSGLTQVYGGTRDLDPSTIERMREAYANAQRYLVVEGIDEEGIMRRVSQDLQKRDEEIETLREQYDATRDRLEAIEYILTGDKKGDLLRRLLDQKYMAEEAEFLLEKINKAKKGIVEPSINTKREISIWENDAREILHGNETKIRKYLEKKSRSRSN